MGRSLPIRAVARLYGSAAWRYPGLVAGTLLALPLTVAMNNLLPPLIIADVLDRLSRRDFTPHQVWGSFHTSIVLYAVLLIVGAVGAWRIVDFFAFRLEANVQRDLAQRCFTHLVEQTTDFHANTFGGALVSQTSKLLGGYIRIADTTMFQVLPLVWSVVGVVVIMAGRSALYALLLAVFTLTYMVLAVFISRPVRRAGVRHAAAESAQTGSLADAMTNVVTVKSFAREDYERSRFAEATQRTYGELMGFMRAHTRQMLVFGTTTSSVSVLAFVVAIWEVVSGSAAIGTVFLITNYTLSIVQQLFGFSNQALRTYNRAFGEAADMVEILGQEPSIQDPAQPQHSRIGAGAITFDHVTFAHPGAGEVLFEDFSLDIAPGEKIGLVGHSGSGKSTFTRLLLRFSDVDEGRILVDGQDIAAISQEDLHARIAYVPQEPLLFHRSIAENIGYGRLGAQGEEVALAARRANASSFVHTLAQGYDTLVGERGVKLSGGQRQRIAVARAMLKDAPILLLDEATSALDSESEVLIQDALWKLMEGRTAIVIAHRLSTIQKMDRIIVLNEGEIVEMGTHTELLADPDGIYAGFWAHQSGSFLDQDRPLPTR